MFENVTCNSIHPYRILRPAHLPAVLEAEVGGLSSALRSGLACLLLESGGCQLTGLTEVLTTALTARVQLSQKLLDAVTTYYIDSCPEYEREKTPRK